MIFVGLTVFREHIALLQFLSGRAEPMLPPAVLDPSDELRCL